MKKEDFFDQLKYQNLKIFSIHDAARIFGKSEKYVSNRLSTMQHIKRIKKGVYYLDDVEISEIASHVVSPSYISLISAFYLHGLTTQIPAEIQVVSPVQHRAISIAQNRIVFIRFRKDRIFGFERSDLGMIATIEKAIIDSLYLNTFIGEVEEVLKNKDGVNFERLTEYGMRMQSGAIINRLGHLLEKFGYNCEKLKVFRSQRYVNYGGKGQFKDIRWRVTYAK